MKVYLRSLGCRLNQSEIGLLARQLALAGHGVVDDPAQADTLVINTCAVTAEAERDSRRLSRRLHRANPAAEIVLTGCYATLAPDQAAALPGVGRVVPNRHKDGLIALLDPGMVEAPGATDARASEPAPAWPAGPSTRAFVKVQDGCDSRCTFCVTTLARGESRSRHVGDVVAEVQALARAGCQEAVLTGVQLGGYGRDLGGADLAGLVRAILDRTAIPRLRLSSVEPWHVSPDFFALWESPRLLPHLHLPLQSGSDRVLRRMARRTTRAEFRALVAAARAAIPDLALSTDLVAGFPGERAADFEAGLDFVRELGFARLHVFGYSPRPGTAAARMTGAVPAPERRERTQRLIALGRAQSLAFHQRHAGRIDEVLWEAGAPGADGLWQGAGYTRNFIHVRTRHPVDLRNRVTRTRLSEPDAEGMWGAVADPGDVAGPGG